MPYIRRKLITVLDQTLGGSSYGLQNIHKHLVPHKGICFDDHITNGLWYCEKCQRNHHGPKGKDFEMLGVLSTRCVDLYYDACHYSEDAIAARAARGH